MKNLQITYPSLSYTQVCAILIKETFKELGYDISLTAMEESTDYDILVLEPDMSQWQWLDILLKSRRQSPEIPVILYSLEMNVSDGLTPLSQDPAVFLISDLNGLKNNFQQILNIRLSNTKSILFVDDDINVLNAYKRSLRKTPWQLFTATGVESALEILNRQRIDLVVTDIKMPGMHGLDLVRKIRGNNNKLPIIICSAYQGLKNDVDLHIHQVSTFVEKPVDMEILKSEIQMILASGNE